MSFEPNYDEAKVPQYTLPELLRFKDGSNVTKETWSKRRQELLEMFRTHVYGRVPQTPSELSFETSNKQVILSGEAIRKEVTALITTNKGEAELTILVYLPKSEKPAPCFVGLNFSGNQTIYHDNGVTRSKWIKEGVSASVGSKAERWQVEKVLARGYALATMHCADVDADDNMANSIRPLFDDARSKDAWGSVAAWSWGLSRMMDYLETDESVEPSKVALLGHSRLGKAALWAGAQDERFALVISNNSGCVGAALSRRRFGETVKAINTQFPTWFCETFKEFNDNEMALPVDQHMLLALIAPRPLYVASAKEDLWADPRGEFLSVLHASEVYELLGKRGLELSTMPATNSLSLTTTAAYHIRAGKHDVTAFDWVAYLDFADRQFPSLAHHAPHSFDTRF